jgi:hypothetical protein
MASSKFSTGKSRHATLLLNMHQSTDSPLNPNNTNARPAIAPSSSPPKPALSSGDKAGIAIAFSIIFLACVIGFVLLMRAREQRRLQRLRQQQPHYPQCHRRQLPSRYVYEKEVKQYSVWELDGRQRSDLDASVRSSSVDLERPARPFFKTVSIHL